MTGDVQLMGLRYFLRQASRIYVTNPKAAADVLLDMHSRERLPQEAREIRVESDAVLVFADSDVERNVCSRN